METPEPAPAPIEVATSKEKSAIIEKFQHRRLELWTKVVDTIKKHPDLARFLSAATNATMKSYPKLAYEAYVGKTADLQKLTPLGRIVNTLITATGLGSYALLAMGRGELAAVSYGASWGLYAAMYLPDLISPILTNTADKLSLKHAKTSQMLHSIAHFVEKPKRLFFKE